MNYSVSSYGIAGEFHWLPALIENPVVCCCCCFFFFHFPFTDDLSFSVLVYTKKYLQHAAQFLRLELYNTKTRGLSHSQLHFETFQVKQR